MARFREAIQITAHLLHSDKPLTFEGKHYRLRDAVLLPRPSHKIPIVIGGAGRQVTLPLVAHYADEWNVGLRTPQQFRELNDYLNSLLDRVGRPHASVRRSMMIFVRDLRLHEVQELVAGLETVGLQRMMLNWPNFDDLEGIATFGKALVTSRV
jgi:alkanesulfonate monooxygenase SsuD/methylene tetrahydromethanopterin reductase-like flavin-dependent oxidoreductase (luciferase family)